MIYISEALLSLCFALLMGSFIIRIVPVTLRPEVSVPDWLLLICTIAIPILSFVPIHQSALLFAKDFGTPYGQMVKSILLDINSGKAWVWTLISSIGLSFLLALRSFRTDKHMPKVGLFITLLLIIWLGYASHASSLYGTKGLIVHSAHFMAAAAWIGVLLVVGWFSKDSANWNRFLSWFSTLALGCVFITIAAGLTLMTFTTPEYVNSWMLPYGQLLLIKHLLILPLLLFAYTNGFGYKRIFAKNDGFNPRPWLKAESIIAVVIFAVTGALGQQTPPHDVSDTLQTVSPSPLFTSIYKGSFSPDMALRYSANLESILLIAAAAIMAVGLIWMYKSNRIVPAFIMGLLTSIFGYFALMFGIA